MPPSSAATSCATSRQSALLLGGMIGLMALCGWLLFGPGGVLGLGLGAALAPGAGTPGLAGDGAAALSGAAS